MAIFCDARSRPIRCRQLCARVNDAVWTNRRPSCNIDLCRVDENSDVAETPDRGRSFSMLVPGPQQGRRRSVGFEETNC